MLPVKKNLINGSDFNRNYNQNLTKKTGENLALDNTKLSTV